MIRLIINSILIILLAVFANMAGFAQKLAVKSGQSNCCYLNQIIIEGETNINQFNFAFDNSRYDVLTINEKAKSDNSQKEIIEFEIPVKGFKGDNYLMENDFYSLLNASSHPLIIVGIEKTLLQKIFFGSSGSVIDFYITISGITKHVKGEYSTNCKNDLTILSGNAKIRLTDFSIDPPQKMLGMLKVKDLIFIKFDISMPSENTLVKL